MVTYFQITSEILGFFSIFQIKKIVISTKKYFIGETNWNEVTGRRTSTRFNNPVYFDLIGVENVIDLPY